MRTTVAKCDLPICFVFGNGITGSAVLLPLLSQHCDLCCCCCAVNRDAEALQHTRCQLCCNAAASNLNLLHQNTVDCTAARPLTDAHSRTTHHQGALIPVRARSSVIGAAAAANWSQNIRDSTYSSCSVPHADALAGNQSATAAAALGCCCC